MAKLILVPPPESLPPKKPRKVPKKYNIKPKLRTLLAIENLIENGGKKGKAMRDAGFSESASHNPQKFFDSPNVKPILEKTQRPILQRLIDLRDRIVQALEDKKSFGAVGSPNLIFMVKNINHDIQLLSGQPTDRTDIMTDEQKKEAEEVLKANLKNG